MKLKDYISILEIRRDDNVICVSFNMLNREYQTYIHNSSFEQIAECKTIESYIKYIPDLGWKIDYEKEKRISGLKILLKD